MAALLARGDADHQLGRVILPARAAERGEQRLDRRLVVRRHQPPGHAALVRQVDAGALIDEPGAQHLLGVEAQLRAIGQALHLAKRHRIVGKRGRGHLRRRHADLAEHRRRRRPLPRQRREGGDALQADIAIILVAQAAVEHRLHRIEHLGPGAIRQRQPGFGAGREDIGGQRFRTGPVARPVAQQPVAVLIGGHVARDQVPHARVAQRDRARRALLEAIIGIGAHIVAHPRERRREAVGKAHLDRAEAGQCARGRRDGELGAGADPAERRRPGLHGHGRRHGLGDRHPVARLAVGGLGGDRPAELAVARRRGEGPHHRGGAARRDFHGQRLAGGIGRVQRHRGGHLHRLVRAVAQREHRPELVARAHQLRQARIDGQVLRGADARHARAEELRTGGRHRDELERSQCVVERHRDPGMAIGIERDLALPEQHRLEILAVETREIPAAATAAGFHRLLAVMPLADHLGLRGRREHRDRAIAHHRIEQVPAVVRSQLEQRFVHRDEGHVRRGGRLAVGALHRHVDIGRVARGIARLVGLHRDIELMAFPADLHLGDAQAIGGLGKVDGRGRLAAVLRPGRPPVAGHAGAPVLPAGHAPAHRHDRDEHVRCIVARHRHLDHRVLAGEADDEAGEHAFPLDRDQRGRVAEGHPDLELGRLARLVLQLLGDDVHAVAIVAAEPPVVVADQPGRLGRAGDIAIGVLGGRHRIDFARYARVELAARQPLRIGGRRAGGRQLGRLHLVVIGIEAADQPAPGRQDLAAVELDRDRLVGERLARSVERDEAQAQIVLLHQPAVALDAELDRGGEDRDAARRGQDLAVGVLIIHLDQHRGVLLERLRHFGIDPGGPVRAQRGGQRLGRRQLDLLVLALAVHRLGALGHGAAAEAVAVIAVRGLEVGEIADARLDRQVRRTAAREIADEQVERQRTRPHRGILGPGDRGLHRRQLIFVDLERLAGPERLLLALRVLDQDGEVVIAHLRPLGRGPFGLAGTVRVDGERQVILRVRPAMAEAQRAAERRRRREARGDRLADDVLHVDRLALADERTVEHGVELLLGRRPAIVQVEIERADAVAPLSEGEAEVVGLARRNHQHVVAAMVAARIGLRLGQAGGNAEAARGIGLALGEQLAGAGVGDAHLGVAHALAAVERGDPDQRLVAPPFEMDAHIGDQRAGRDVARRLAAEQRLAEPRAGEFDDVEAGLAERDADHFEILALARQADLERLAAGRGEQRLGAGLVDPHGLGAALHFVGLVLGRIGERAEPFGDLAVAALDLQALAGHGHLAALQLGLDVADRDREDAALLRFEDAEIAGELHQRRRRVELDVEREALRIGELAAALVLHIGGKDQLGGRLGRERRLELQVGDRRLVLVVVAEDRRQFLAVGRPDAHRLGLGPGDRRGEAHPGVLHRAAAGLRVDARAFEAGAEFLAHGEVETLVGAGGTARGALDVLAPDQRHVAAGGQRPAALHRDDAGEGLGAILRLFGQRLGQAGLGQEAAHFPAIGAEIGQQLGRDIGGKHVDRDLLAQPVDRAIGVGADRGGIGRQVRRDDEDLVLLDLAAIAIGQHRAGDRPARIDGELLLALQRIARQALEPVAQRELAGDAAGERPGEFMDEGLLVDPAALAADRAIDLERRFGARIAQGHHRHVEAGGEALDRAVADAGRRHLDLRAVVAERSDRPDGRQDQSQYAKPGNELHRQPPPRAAMGTIAGHHCESSDELTVSVSEGNAPIGLIVPRAARFSSISESGEWGQRWGKERSSGSTRSRAR